MTVATIELLRHGDTAQRSYRGQLDDPLSELGWQQLRQATAQGQWDAIVSSTLQRCAAFAAELAALRGLPLRLDNRLVEYHFGHWQGVPIEEIDRDQGEALGRFWADPVAHPPPGGESFAQFRGRLSAAIDEIASIGSNPGPKLESIPGQVQIPGQGPGQRVLVVTHGGAIRALRCLAEGRPFGEMVSIQVPHASRHRLAWPPPRGIAP
ncbi:MAG TPA: histidine phosphatase family protein [Stenotrophomonas sp.]|jgi:alpha-ribazole phosphatase